MKKSVLVFALVITMLFGVSKSALASGSVSAISAKETYGDIGGTWFEKAAENYGYTEIFSDGSGKFNSDKEITRMEFARMLHRALDINIAYFAPTDIKEYYNDVGNSDLGAGELYDLVTAGIIDVKGSFEPKAPLSREEMIHFTMNALDYITGGDYAVILIMPAPFDDDKEIGESYKAEIYKSVVLQLINGRGNNMLFPKQGTTRAEAVVVAGRLVNVIDSLMQKVVVSSSTKEENGSLEMTLSIFNNTDKTVTIQNPSSQKFDFKLFDKNGEILYTWSADKMFATVMTNTEIKAGEIVEFSDVLESGSYSAIKGKIASMKAYITGTSNDFEINASGYCA